MSAPTEKRVEAAAATSPELRKAFESHLEETQGHIERLEQVLKNVAISRESGIGVEPRVRPEARPLGTVVDVEEDRRERLVLRP